MRHAHTHMRSVPASIARIIVHRLGGLQGNEAGKRAGGKKRQKLWLKQCHVGRLLQAAPMCIWQCC